MRLSIHRKAIEELEDAYQFYEGSVAEDFERDFSSLLSRILDFPEAFPNYGGTFRKAVMPRFPYTIFYRLDPGRVRVVAVAHHKRRPDYWKSRR